MSVMPLDQAAQLRRYMDSVATAAHGNVGVVHGTATRVIAVASGKGGVGKTQVAINLSMALARQGQRVVLFDADLGTANVDVALNIHSTRDLSHVLRGACTLDEAAVALEKNLRVIVGASGLSRAADLCDFERGELINALCALETGCDVMVIDCGAGISQNVLAFAQAAGELLLVTTPEPTALTDAYALIKAFARSARRPRIDLIVNQARTIDEGESAGRRIVDVAQRFLGLQVNVAGHIPHDNCVLDSVRNRTPLIARYPRSSAARSISALASRLVPQPASAASHGGFFRRLAALFD